MYKKIIITFLLVFSAFLGFDIVSAREISQFCDYSEKCFTTEDLNNIIKSNNIDTSIYDSYLVLAYYDYDQKTYHKINESHFNIFVFSSRGDSTITSPRVHRFALNSLLFYASGINTDGNYDLGFYTVHLEEPSNFDNISLEFIDTSDRSGSVHMYNGSFEYYTNLNINDPNGGPNLVKNDVEKEFTINTYDTEFGNDWFGVTYTQGEQDNTVNFYIQDSGILTTHYSKGYEIDKIYYDEELTKEAFFDDVKEEDCNLYVTWKSKIEITSDIKKDSSLNDFISITYDFSKIYNDNYTYWISNDGENYVDVTSNLNNENKYISDVYFFGRYYARVQDENNNTISVNHIRIKYYYISINTEVGSETDDDGNIVPYIILDYSSYKNIKDNLIFEYSIDDGKTWVNVTNRLDSNLKYKLYIKIGDYVRTRVRTNGSTVLPGSSTGSNYIVDEDFLNSILTDDNFEYILNKFIKPIKFIITSITEFYEDYCPPVVQNFLYLSFIILIVLFIIKLIW